MSLVGDLFLHPKQAVENAFKTPSLAQGVLFMVLPTLALIIGKFSIQSTIPVETFALFFANDLIIWIVTGLVLYAGIWVFNQKSAKRELLKGILTALALRGLYTAVFLFIVMTVIPLAVFPEFTAATQGLTQGALSADDYIGIFQDTLADISPVQVLLLAVFLLAMLALFLYALYALYLTVANALRKTVAVHVVALLLLLVIGSMLGNLLSLVG